ncbi:hypothetical protein BMF94_0647 [Rhodotorula taiwanensis]|uniref:F-box domain-containing protein n=1 Tax=Rhodotorula taiwanensis TaxID=741276 RepID=A0A2S5BI42_9BASI|nr:hypothetical protein BMF94_0647 [Rhodotorula taiwanensis]
MAARTQYQRKAAARVSYAPPNESDASDDEWGGGASSAAHKARKDAPQADESDSGDATAEPSSGDEFRLGQARKRKAKKPRKKVKRTKQADEKAERAPKGKKRVGKLEAVTLVPTEVLLEIFSYLGPGDLLSLSKVSKSYRSIVTGDKSQSLWRRARAKYKLPDVSGGGFTELQYAEMMFGKGCTNCDRKSGTMDFYLRSKLCSECRKASLVKLEQLAKTHPNGMLEWPMCDTGAPSSGTSSTNQSPRSPKMIVLAADAETYKPRAPPAELVPVVHYANNLFNASRTLKPTPMMTNLPMADAVASNVL